MKLKKKADAKVVYEHLIKGDPDNSSILNNLSNLYKDEGDIDAAWKLILKAYEINENDEVIKRNYDFLSEIIQEKEEKAALFKSAVDTLENENEFVIGKLTNFIINSRKDDAYKKGIIAIPKWKLKVFMKTDEQKASSLIEQWLNKSYVVLTGDRGSFNELEYELNPYIQKAISNLTPKNINANWVNVLTSLDSSSLEEHLYLRSKK